MQYRIQGMNKPGYSYASPTVDSTSQTIIGAIQNVHIENRYREGF